MSKALATYKSHKSLASKSKGAGLVLDGRAFHVTDYRKSAALLKSMRLDKSGKPKGAAAQGRIDAMATVMASVFEADAHEFGCPFSVGYFIAGTK